MQEYVVSRPDEGAMNRILEAHPADAAGAILRLAWQAGLLREEIQRLTWSQVELSAGRLALADRFVPLPPALCAWLEGRAALRDRGAEQVVLSDRGKAPLTPQSISRLARQALDREGQTAVRLMDLRHDFILRQLETHDWQYVSRITGMETAALRARFGAYFKEKAVPARSCLQESAPLDEFALWQVIRAEKTSPAGAALCLTWQAGLQLGEIAALRWDQVDLAGKTLRLPGRGEVPLAGSALEILRRLRETAETEFVLAAPRGRGALDRTRLSKLARAALIRGGLNDVTLRDLRMDRQLREGGETQVAAWLREHRSITRNQAAALLGVPPPTAYHRLKQMVKRGRLTQVGGRYYLRGTVVPPEKQAPAVVEYLKREGFAYRQDIARLLGVDVKQCRPILQRMIDGGQIAQDRQKYFLNEA